MIFRFLKKCFWVDIPEKYRNDFYFETGRATASRAKTLCILFLALELGVLTAFCIARRDQLSTYPNPVYLAMYIILSLASLAFFILFTRLGRNVEKNHKRIYWAGISLCSFMLLWCVAITLLDQSSSTQVVVYTTMFIGIAVFSFFEPFTILIIFLSVHALFISLLPEFQKSSDLLFGIFVNTSAAVVMAWLTARMFFKNYVSDFINRHIIQEKNKELKDMNQKLLDTNRKLEEMSTTDSLTGIYNRRKFDELLKKQWGNCKRFAIPITLIMIDIDGFKQYNDIQGHQAGDTCIRAVANSLSNMMRRSSDILARYGGDEFIIALSGLQSQEAFVFAELIRKGIEALPICRTNSETPDHVTISQGICTIVPSGDISISGLIQSADNALYQAKAKGRNNTVSMVHVCS